MGKNKEKKSTLKIVLMITIPILIVGLVVGCFFLKNYLDLKKPIDEIWGQTYYLYLKDVKENNKAKEAELPTDMKNAKINFYEFKSVKDPVMTITYEQEVTNEEKKQVEKEQHTNIYYIEEESVNTLVYYGKTTVEFLYNIEDKEYDYYIHRYDEDSDTYSSLSKQVESYTNGPTNCSNEEGTEENCLEALKDYTFKKDEKSSITDVNGNEISIPKFDETFVKVETEDKSIDYNLELSEKELKKEITAGVENYQSQDEIITEKVKDSVEETVKQVDAKQEEMKKAEEEVKKKEEEEKAKKEAEELAKGYAIGPYRLKYGTYKNLPMDNISITITLSPNGKCHYSGKDPSAGTSNINTDCTYTQTKAMYYGVMTYFLKMNFKSGGSTSWQMTKSNAFNNQWLSFEYKG